MMIRHTVDIADGELVGFSAKYRLTCATKKTFEKIFERYERPRFYKLAPRFKLYDDFGRRLVFYPERGVAVFYQDTLVAELCQSYIMVNNKIFKNSRGYRFNNCVYKNINDESETIYVRPRVVKCVTTDVIVYYRGEKFFRAKSAGGFQTLPIATFYKEKTLTGSRVEEHLQLVFAILCCFEVSSVIAESNEEIESFLGT